MCEQRKTAAMSGLVRNLADQVLKTMSPQERAEQVNYVTDRMIERMDNQERVKLLLAIIDRVMSNLSADERLALARDVAQRMTAEDVSTTTPATTAEEAED
jgi:hypothetical protein